MRNTALACLGVIAVSLIACEQGEPTAEKKDQQAVQNQQAHYQKAQPMPFMEYSLERDITIQLYEARNQSIATHTVWRGDTSVIEGDCPSIGFPLPYDTSLTNPLQPIWGRYQAQGGVAVEQAEPNGIFASKNSTATWVRCVVDGKEVPVYIEGKVTAYPYPVSVDYEANRINRVAGKKPSVVIKKKQPKK